MNVMQAARRSALAALGASTVLVGSGCSGQAATSPKMAPITPAANDSLRAAITLPSGFTIQYFARGLAGVRFLAVASDGSVYASLPRSGQVVRLVDTNGDGAADQQQVVISGLDRPHGLAFHGGWLYIAGGTGVWRVHLKGDGTANGAPEKIVSYDGSGNHWTRSIVFGADSNMYIAIGSTCNLCVETDTMRAAVTQYDANGGHGRRYAFGLRNAVGIELNPVTKAIWVSQNERDNITPNHEDLPPDELNILKDGGDFGWPYCYTLHAAPVPNPEYNDAARCAPTVPAALEIQAHSAPLGMTFLNRATKFPAAYQGDLLMALHGSWNRTVPTGAKVIRVHIAANLPTSYEDFATGWQLPDGSRWGRPVDVQVTSDGAVLISDDVGGAIYRVSH